MGPVHLPRYQDPSESYCMIGYAPYRAGNDNVIEDILTPGDLSVHVRMLDHRTVWRGPQVRIGFGRYAANWSREAIFIHRASYQRYTG